MTDAFNGGFLRDGDGALVITGPDGVSAGGTAPWPQATAGEDTYNRLLAMSGVALSTGSLRLTYFTARRTETITKAVLTTAATAAGATPTLVRAGIWEAGSDGALTLLVGSTPNDTALLASANTEYSKALSAPFVKQEGVLYAFGVLVVTAAAAPTVPGVTLTTPRSSGATHSRPRSCGVVSGQTDLPATVAAGSVGDSTFAIYGHLAIA